MNRTEALAQAVAAAGRAKELAQAADRDLTHPTLAHHVPKTAATSSAFADVAAAFAAIAAALPEEPTNA